MSGAAATTPTRELTIVDSTSPAASLTAPSWTAEDLDALKQTMCAQLTDAEFRVFLAACRRLGLDPMARQIYALKLDNRMTPQVSIDGFRLISERTGKYAGMLGPYWCGLDGEWREVWLDDKPPAAAKVGILRRDFDQPVWGVARYKSYARNTTPWGKFPDVMIAKVAESLARRYAFPNELSGVYSPEEMQQAHLEEREATEPDVPMTVTVTAMQSDHALTREEPVTLRSLYERSQRLGMPARQWTEVKTAAGGDLQQIAGALDQIEYTTPATPTTEQLAEIEYLCLLVDMPQPNSDTAEQAELNLKSLRRKAREAGHEISETPPADGEPIEHDLRGLGPGKGRH